MPHGSKKLSIKNRRGVSQIIGSLIVLAIVASVGSVILFQGLNQISAFNYDLSIHDKEHISEIREAIIFEHVRFDPTPGPLPAGTELYLYLANVGTVDSTITAVTVVKIDTQELIIWREGPLADEATILIEDHTLITLTSAILPLGPDGYWDSIEYGPLDPLNKYKITVTTSKGNFFEKVASPFNS